MINTSSTTFADERGKERLLPPEPRIAGSRRLVYISFFFPAFAGMLFGFDIGSTSGALLSLACELGDADGDGCEYFDDNNGHSLLLSVLTSTSLSGAFLGTLLVFWLGGPLGRRREIIVGSTLYMAGSVISIIGPASAPLPFVVVGRAVYGLGIAFSMHAAPVYISEIAPSDVRGFLVSAKEAFIVGGILLGFAVSAIVDATGLDGDGYRVTWGLPLPFALAIFLGMKFIAPPSPRWLVLRQQETQGQANMDVSEAASVLCRLRGGQSAEAMA